MVEEVSERSGVLVYLRVLDYLKTYFWGGNSCIQSVGMGWDFGSNGVFGFWFIGEKGRGAAGWARWWKGMYVCVMDLWECLLWVFFSLVFFGS